MQIIFYNYGGKTNVLYKTLDPSTAITRTGTLRRGTSIITPSIDVQTDLATFKSYNYCYIPDFHRYYYIMDRVSVSSSLIRLTMNCDTLRSYNYRIDKSQCYIERASIGYEPTIKDDNRAFRGIATKTYLDLDKKHPSAWCTTLEHNPFIRWNDLDDNKCKYIVTFSCYDEKTAVITQKKSNRTAIPNPLWNILKNKNGTGVGTTNNVLTSQYMGTNNNMGCIVCNAKAVQKISGWVLTHDKEIKESGSVDIRIFPIEYPYDTTQSPVKTIFINTINGHINFDDDELVYYTDGAVISGNDFYLEYSGRKAIYGKSLWRMTQLDKYRLWVPYLGWIDLDRNIFLQTMEQYPDETSFHVSTEYIINPYTGKAYVYVYNPEHEIMLFRKECNRSIDVPITYSNIQSNDQKFDSTALNMTIKLIGAGIAIAAGLFAGPLGSGATLATTTAIATGGLGFTSAAAKALLQVNQLHDVTATELSNTNSYAYAPNKFRLEITFSNPIVNDYPEAEFKDYIHETGLPVNKFTTITALLSDSSNGAETPSSSSEFILASSCDIKLVDGMTIGERDIIESLLSKGVYTHET